jgi:multidrug efflux pump subunit AcrB
MSLRLQNVDKTTYAREFGKSVVMLDVKESWKNTIEASDKIKTIIDDAKTNFLPKYLNLTLSNDASKTLNQVDDLVNNVIFGIILVVAVLMFFLGFRNTLCWICDTCQCFLSFMVLDALGYTMNTMILFGLIMGLGMLVDNGIVVVENVYRLMEDEGMDRLQATKKELAKSLCLLLSPRSRLWLPLYLLVYGRGYGTIYGLFSHNAFCRWAVRCL